MISIDDLINKRYDENKPYAVLTFDDGFKDNLTVAMPILKKYSARATIAAVPFGGMKPMNADQVAEIVEAFNLIP